MGVRFPGACRAGRARSDEPTLMTPVPHHLDLELEPFRLEAGVPLARLVVRTWWWGPEADLPALADAGAVPAPAESPEPVPVRRALPAGPLTQRLTLPSSVPTIVCVHALTGDARVGGSGGWWEPLVGPGAPLDPTTHRILCFNNLGSCYGTTGAADEGFPRLGDTPHGEVAPDKGGFALPDDLPAPITTWDQARAILLALDTLGVDEVALVCGGSLGGMIATALAALAPDRFPRVLALAALDRATPWIIGWNHIGRQAIAEALRVGADPTRMLGLAREIAHMTYRAGAGLMERHGRRVASADQVWSPRAPYAVQTYLEHQALRLVRRYDPRAYVSQLDAMDHHDLSRPPPTPDAHESWTTTAPWPGLARVSGRLDTVAIDSDELFFAREIHDLVVRHRMHGHEATWALVQSAHGHDAFLMAWEPLRRLVDACVRRIPGSESP